MRITYEQGNKYLYNIVKSFLVIYSLALLPPRGDGCVSKNVHKSYLCIWKLFDWIITCLVASNLITLNIISDVSLLKGVNRKKQILSIV